MVCSIRPMPLRPAKYPLPTARTSVPVATYRAYDASATLALSFQMTTTLHQAKEKTARHDGGAVSMITNNDYTNYYILVASNVVDCSLYSSDISASSEPVSSPLPEPSPAQRLSGWHPGLLKSSVNHFFFFGTQLLGSGTNALLMVLRTLFHS